VPRPSRGLLDEVVGRLRTAGCVFAEQEAALLHEEAGSAAELDRMVARRVGGEPLEQVVGWAAFHGLRIAVAPTVFVPRRRTELLAREAIRRAGPGAVVVDLCCGSGAVAAAVRAEVPEARVLAADRDPAAVACARRNLPPEQVFEGDLYDALPPALRGRVDVLAVNAPYVPSDAVALMPPEARDHEARVALDGGADGLDVQRRVVAGAGEWLTGEGWLLVETSMVQAPATRELFVAAGLRARAVRSEELDGTLVSGTPGGRLGASG
jgi:release factor glutamine methyltransferase